SLFFFSSRRRHTRFSRDWSSDVCSSDLASLFNLFSPTESKSLPPPSTRTACSISGNSVSSVLAITRGVQNHTCILSPQIALFPRSEERRVGKECRSGGSPYHLIIKPQIL